MDEDDARRRAVERLEALIGEEEVRALMGSVPPFRWEELATKQDLRVLRADMDAQFATLNATITGLENSLLAIDARLSGIEHRFSGIDEHFAAMDNRFAGIDEHFTAMDNRFAGIDEHFTAIDDQFTAVNERLDVLQAVTQQTRTLMVAMMGTIVAVGSLAITLTQLG